MLSAASLSFADQTGAASSASPVVVAPEFVNDGSGALGAASSESVNSASDIEKGQHDDFCCVVCDRVAVPLTIGT